MAKRNVVTEAEPVVVPEPTLFERLEALLAPLDEASAPGVQHEFVRLALLNVTGAIKHVVSALDQVRLSEISDRNRAALDAKQAAQVEREKESR